MKKSDVVKGHIKIAASEKRGRGIDIKSGGGGQIDGVTAMYHYHDVIFPLGTAISITPHPSKYTSSMTCIMHSSYIYVLLKICFSVFPHCGIIHIIILILILIHTLDSCSILDLVVACEATSISHWLQVSHREPWDDVCSATLALHSTY